MDRFSLVQVVFNLVFLVNIFYLHRKVAALRLRAPEDAGAAEAVKPSEAPESLSAQAMLEAVNGTVAHPDDSPQETRPPKPSRKERRAARRAFRRGSLLTLGLSAGGADTGGANEVVEAAESSERQELGAGSAGASVRGSGWRADRSGETPKASGPSRVPPGSLDELIAAAERAESGVVLQARLRSTTGRAQGPGKRDASPGARVLNRSAPAGSTGTQSGKIGLPGPPDGSNTRLTSFPSPRGGENGPAGPGFVSEPTTPTPPGPSTLEESVSGRSSRGASGGEDQDSRQRAAEELRANLKRLQARFEAGGLASPRARSPRSSL